ncbi:DUF6959 family protein [Thermodesulfobacteriota bacterium]
MNEYNENESKDNYARILCHEVNRTVVQIPGRSFPGLVLQGDTLFTLLTHAKSHWDLVQRSDNPYLESGAKSLYEMLKDLYEHYNQVLDEHRDELSDF